MVSFSHKKGSQASHFYFDTAHDGPENDEIIFLAHHAQYQNSSAFFNEIFPCSPWKKRVLYSETV